MPLDAAYPDIAFSVCPHDCPSACALDIERLAPDRIGAVRGAGDNRYTAGVVCAKVARYAERVHHPDRLTRPLRRTGPKGSGDIAEVSWDEALDRVAVTLFVEPFDGLQPGVTIVEGIWPGSAFEEEIGINLLVSAEPGPLSGGAVFHDTAVWIAPAEGGQA